MWSFLCKACVGLALVQIYEKTIYEKTTQEPFMSDTRNHKMTKK